MGPDQLRVLQYCQVAISAFWIAASVACSLLVVIWRAFLTNRYLTEALEREMRSCSAEKRNLLNWCFRHSNAMQKRLWESFLREPVPTLEDLVERTERAWSLKQSARKSAENADTIEIRTQDLEWDRTRR